MKKVILLVGSLLACLFMLAGCFCDHVWTDPDCVMAKTCSECQATEGQPLGHIWTEATCEFPKTCTNCAATEGQPLPHSEATRYCSVDYVTLSAKRQVYCSSCNQTISEEEVVLDALYDDTGFFFDSEAFLERYSAVASITEFMYSDFVADAEETTADVLTLEYTADRVGQVKIAGGEDYSIRVRFTFYGLDEIPGEDSLPRCTRIGVSVLTATIGDPSAGAAISEEDAEKANSVMLNFLIWRNTCVTLMTCDPTLEGEYPNSVLMNLLLNLLDSGEDGTVLNNSVVHNNIRYSFNGDGELMIERVS